MKYFAFVLWQMLKIYALTNILYSVTHYSGGMVTICLIVSEVTLGLPNVISMKASPYPTKSTIHVTLYQALNDIAQ